MGKAVGKHAFGICDRTGFRYPVKELVFEFSNGKRTGLRVGKDVADKDHPQNFVGRIKTDDPQSIKDARPDRLEPMTVFVGGAGFFEYNNSMQKSTKDSPVVGLTVGNVTVSIS